MREVAYLANILWKREHLQSRSIALDQPPHHQKIVIDDSGIEVQVFYKKHVESNRLRPKDAMAQEHTIVFTCFSMLATLCHCNKLEYKVSLSVDGTHNMVNND